MQYDPWLFLKFGKKEYLEQFQKGRLYMNSWQEFVSIENEEQKDIYEGTTEWLNPDITPFKINDRVLKRINGTLSVSLQPKQPYIKIFCLSIICKRDEIRDDYKIFDDRMKKFGDSFLLISNPKIFLNKLQKSLISLLLENTISWSDYRKIQYFNPNLYDGEVGPFKKIDHFSHQKEFRIAVKDDSDKPFILEIGSLKNISSLDKISNFINKITKNVDTEGYVLHFS